jgi:HSP20 family molecular chaperone IbpA
LVSFPYAHNDKGENRSILVPASDYTYDDTGVYTLVVELPGVSKEHIHVTGTKKSLLVETNKSEDNTLDLHYRKRFSFHHEINPETIKASYADGILTLKIDRVFPKQFDIKIN